MRLFLIFTLALALALPLGSSALAQDVEPQIDPEMVEQWAPVALEISEFIIERQWEPIMALANGTTALDQIMSRLPVSQVAQTQTNLTDTEMAYSDDALPDTAAFYERVIEAMR